MFKFMQRMGLTPPAVQQTSIDTPRARFAGGTGKFGLEVSGESHYQSALRSASQRARRTGDGQVIDVLIQPEPTNRFDPDAARVVTADNGALLGYLSRARAQQYKRVLGTCHELALDLQCSAVLRGGEEGSPNIGIWLDLAFPAQLKKMIAESQRDSATNEI